MASPNVALKTFVLKLNSQCLCNGCRERVKEAKKLVRNITGVRSSKIDRDENTLTISGTVKPDRVIKELEKNKKSFELLREEPVEEIDDQRIATVPQKIGPVKPDRVIKELKKNKKSFELLREEPVEEIDDQRIATVPQQEDLHVGDGTRKHSEVVFSIFVEGTTLIIKLIICLLTLPFEALEYVLTKNSQYCCQNNIHDKLELKNFNKRFTCDGCKEDGFGSRYRCEICHNYELHKECFSPRPTISHMLFQKSTFKFRKQKVRGRYCDACGNGIYGDSYHCKANDYDLHPCCTKLKCKLSIGDMDFNLCGNDSSKCLWCNKKEPNLSTSIPGWSYVSGCRKYRFHVHCITHLMHEAWKKGDMDDNNDPSEALKKTNLKLMAKLNKNGGRVHGADQSLVILTQVLVKVGGVLLGDPTTLIASAVFELLKALIGSEALAK